MRSLLVALSLALVPTASTSALWKFCATNQDQETDTKSCRSLPAEAAIPITWYGADSKEQVYTVGARALYRLNVENWRTRILTSFRSAERYGGPLWAVTYQDEKGLLHALPFRKESSARLGIHPDFVMNEISDSNVNVTHKIVPYGMSMIDTATIKNTGSTTITLWHYQIWDLYYEPIADPGLDILVRPIPGKHLTKAFLERALMKEDFEMFDPIQKGFKLGRRFELVRDRADVAKHNFFPADSIVGFSEVDEIFDLLDAPSKPGAPGSMRREQLVSLLDPNYTYGPVWVGVKKLVLTPGQTVNMQSWQKLDTKLSVKIDAMDSMKVANIDSYKDQKMGSLDAIQSQSVFAEILQNAHQLKAFSTYDEVSKKVLTTQGAFYFDGFGLHTALRDFTNVIAGLVHIVPELARSNLEYCFNMQSAHDGYLPYDWSGVNVVNRLSGERADQPVALIWATAEYMNATHNWNWFYDEQLAFYPPKSDNLPPTAHGYSPYEHVRAAFYYFRDHIGRGDNGLPKVHSSDWSDALNSLAGKMGSAAFRHSVENGESPMVGQMAVVVFKDLLRALQHSPRNVDDTFIYDLSVYVEQTTNALRRLFARNGKYFPRAVLRDSHNRELLVLHDRVDVAGQVWALLDVEDNPILTKDQRNHIIDLILEHNNTPLGVRTVVPPEGAKADYFILQGRPWSVIRGWFTVALHKNGRSEEAWGHFWKTTLAHHNSLFAPKDKQGNVVDKLYSGFDGWNFDGSAWNLKMLPMNNRRWNNANHNGMALWAVFKLLNAKGATPQITRL